MPDVPELRFDSIAAGGIPLALGPGTHWSAASNITLLSFGLVDLLRGARLSGVLRTAAAAVIIAALTLDTFLEASGIAWLNDRKLAALSGPR